ncbi:MAG TPA: LolA-related protein [Burkholderiales bacterium]|nr:LolA-related protein [Burkholderiales bacterium]
MTSGAVRRALASLAALALLAAGDAARAEWGLPQLMSELGRVQHATARFVERKYLKMLKTPLVVRGKLEYFAPGRVEKRTLEPRPEALIVDGDVVVLESATGRRTLALQDNPVVWAFVESIRSTLNGDLEMLERFYAVDFDGGPDAWRLRLAPKDERMNRIVSLILISGERDRIETIEIREAQGDRSVMTVLEERR